MKRIRDFFYLCVIALYTLILGIFAILVSFIYPVGGEISYFIAKIWSWLILKTLRVKVKVYGLENIMNLKTYILMSNHQSHIDVASIIATFPHSFRFLAKKELVKVPIFGWAMALQGHILIDRSDREQAFKSIDKAAEKLSKGTRIVVFPEGTRGDGKELLPFKKGGFVLAVKSKVPVVPVAISGSEKVLPRKSLSLGDGREVRIWVGKPIDTSRYSMENKEELMEIVKSEIKKGKEILIKGGQF